MSSRAIPPLLEPYLTSLASSDAAGSLVLLTSVLGTSTNWLVLRYMQALLRQSIPQLRRTAVGGTAATAGVGTGAGEGLNHQKLRDQQAEGKEEEGQEETAVLLVSFLRDFAFWGEGMARLGIDLEAAGRRGRFAFVDGLCGGLFDGSAAASPSPVQSQTQSAWKRPLKSPRPSDISRVVLDLVEQLKNGGPSAGIGGQTSTEKDPRRRQKVVLMVDGLDFVLAASTPSPSPSPSLETEEVPLSVAMKDMLMDLREATHATILILSADSPLIHTPTDTPLERQHAWFTLSVAHDADLLLSLRPLDTGAARDVSGVIRITTTGNSTARIAPGDRDGDRDCEYLYHVGGDGGVRVFERGQG